MDSLEQMQLFVKAADAGSFSQAAREHNQAPSSVSRKMAALEDGLGVKLFVREGNDLGLTEAGMCYYERSQLLLSDIRDAKRAVRSFQEEPKGVIRISSVVQIAELFFTDMLPVFLERFPEIQVELMLDDQVANIVRDRIDLAFRISVNPDPELIARKLVPNTMVLAASPGFLAQYGRPQHPSDLPRFPAVTYWNRRAFNVWQWTGKEGYESVAVSSRVSVSSGKFVLDSALAGTGLILMPTWYLAEALSSGNLIRLLPDYDLNLPEFRGANMYALYPPTRALVPKVRVFLDHVLEALRERYRAFPDLAFDH